MPLKDVTKRSASSSYPSSQKSTVYTPQPSIARYVTSNFPPKFQMSAQGTQIKINSIRWLESTAVVTGIGIKRNSPEYVAAIFFFLRPGSRLDLNALRFPCQCMHALACSRYGLRLIRLPCSGLRVPVTSERCPTSR